MPRIARQRQRSNSVKVAVLKMKAVKTKTKNICEQLQVPKSTFYDWVREAKAAGTRLETPGQVSRQYIVMKILSMK